MRKELTREASTAGEPKFLNVCKRINVVEMTTTILLLHAHTHSEETPICACSGGTEKADVETGASALFLLEINSMLRFIKRKEAENPSFSVFELTVVRVHSPGFTSAGCQLHNAKCTRLLCGTEDTIQFS